MSSKKFAEEESMFDQFDQVELALGLLMFDLGEVIYDAYTSSVRLSMSKKERKLVEKVIEGKNLKLKQIVRVAHAMGYEVKLKLKKAR